MNPDLCLIVAASRNNVIGRKGKIPWHISGDLRYVKEKTWGKPIIMGRKTFESLGRPLSGRLNIVVTSRILPVNGIECCTSLDKALDKARSWAVTRTPPADEIFIFGGGGLYREALGKHPVKRIYLTRVHIDVEKGDAFFPVLEDSSWQEVSRKDIKAADQGAIKNPPHSYIVLERRL